MDAEQARKLNDYTKALKKHNLMPSAQEAENRTNNVQSDDEKIHQLEIEVRKLSFGLAESKVKISEIIKVMNQLISEVKELKRTSRVTSQKGAGQGATQQTLAEEKKGTKDTTKPIDRNKVAPADVAIEKMFYFGKK